MDECKHCTVRGDLQKCLETKCNHHESWMVKELKKKIKRFENMLFERGAMAESPCFICGYNGPGYYNPNNHPCAKRHHQLFDEP